MGKGFSQNENDILHLAAIIQNIDLLITCDSFVAHLAGALGAPVWVLLKHITSWRWMTKKTESPWYPSMKLFRQKEDGTWKEIIEDIASCIQDFAKDYIH